MNHKLPFVNSAKNCKRINNELKIANCLNRFLFIICWEFTYKTIDKPTPIQQENLLKLKNELCKMIIMLIDKKKYN
jgi:hypothetical protein